MNKYYVNKIALLEEQIKALQEEKLSDREEIGILYAAMLSFEQACTLPIGSARYNF